MTLKHKFKSLDISHSFRLLLFRECVGVFDRGRDTERKRMAVKAVLSAEYLATKAGVKCAVSWPVLWSDFPPAQLQGL